MEPIVMVWNEYSQMLYLTAFSEHNAGVNAPLNPKDIYFFSEPVDETDDFEIWCYNGALVRMGSVYPIEYIQRLADDITWNIYFYARLESL